MSDSIKIFRRLMTYKSSISILWTDFLLPMCFSTQETDSGISSFVVMKPTPWIKPTWLEKQKQLFSFQTGIVERKKTTVGVEPVLLHRRSSRSGRLATAGPIIWLQRKLPCSYVQEYTDNQIGNNIGSRYAAFLLHWYRYSLPRKPILQPI